MLSQDHEIGDYNEVVRIRTGEGPDVSYEYDSRGPPDGGPGRHAGRRTSPTTTSTGRCGSDLDGDTLADVRLRPRRRGARRRPDHVGDAGAVRHPGGVRHDGDGGVHTAGGRCTSRPGGLRAGAAHVRGDAHRHLVPDAVLGVEPEGPLDCQR